MERESILNSGDTLFEGCHLVQNTAFAVKDSPFTVSEIKFHEAFMYQSHDTLRGKTVNSN